MNTKQININKGLTAFCIAYMIKTQTNKKDYKMREYKGYDIFPSDYNASGIKWYAYSNNGGKLRADTLKGIKRLITEESE